MDRVNCQRNDFLKMTTNIPNLLCLFHLKFRKTINFRQKSNFSKTCRFPEGLGEARWFWNVIFSSKIYGFSKILFTHRILFCSHFSSKWTSDKQISIYLPGCLLFDSLKRAAQEQSQNQKWNCSFLPFLIWGKVKWIVHIWESNCFKRKSLWKRASNGLGFAFLSRLAKD